MARKCFKKKAQARAERRKGQRLYKTKKGWCLTRPGKRKKRKKKR